MSTRKLKAFRMWANYYTGAMNDPCVHKTRARAEVASAGCAAFGGIPVAVIPLDDMEGLIVTAAAAHYKAWSGIGKPTNGDCMRAALTAIGVLPRARAKKGRK